MKKNCAKKMTVAYTIGRFNPAHKGHILYFLWLLSRFDRLIIGIGSCYEVGSPRHPLLAFFREKIIRLSLLAANADMSRVSFVHLQDFELDNWDGWWRHVNSIPGVENITHFVTGNEKDILDVIKKKGIKTRFDFINPEKEMPSEFLFPYHATDLRKAIADGDYELFRKIASFGAIILMSHAGGFSGMREALQGNGTRFIPGRQTVDCVVTCRGKNGRPLVLSGFRKKNKENFPGYFAIPGGAIETYENPMRAAIRELEEETGLKVEFADDSLEPAHVIVRGKSPIISELKFVKLFSTENPKFGGNQGGSSQVFCIHLDCEKEMFGGMIRSDSDLEKVSFRSARYLLRKKLAYQQGEMLKKALKLL